MPSKRYDVLNPIDFDDSRTMWVKIGTLFENSNGSLSGEIQQLPLNGRVVVFPAKEKKKTSSDPQEEIL